MNNNNVKTKTNRNPFKTTNQGQLRVGSTFGERKLLQQKPQVATRIPVRKQQPDQFKPQKRKNLAQFAGATFKTGMSIFSPERAHKLRRHDYVEKGMASAARDLKPTSDTNLVRFLDRIRDKNNPHLHNSAAFRKACAASKQTSNANKPAAMKPQYPTGRPVARTGKKRIV